MKIPFFFLLFIMIAVGCDGNMEAVIEAGTDPSSKAKLSEVDTVNKNNPTDEKAFADEPVGAGQQNYYTIELYKAEESYGADGYDHEDDVDVDRDIGYSSPIPYKGRMIAGFPEEIPIPRKPVDMTMRKDNLHEMIAYSVSFDVDLPIEDLIELYQSYLAKAAYLDVEETREDHYYDITGTRDGRTFSLSFGPSTTWDHYYSLTMNYIVIGE